jgi:homoserine kinase type II
LSVYTTVDRNTLVDWLQPLDVGDLIEHVGIAAGVQNSNYFVTTTAGRFVLTLFEVVDPLALDFYLHLQAHLAQHGLPCPLPKAPLAGGAYWRILNGKPAALLSCLPGRAIEQPTASHCRAVGTALAQLHLAAQALADAPANPCGASWRQAVGDALLPYLSANDAALLRDELAFQSVQDYSALPQGVIHADLFRDNVLWDDAGQLSGLLDFYFAGVDAWLFDLAVVANDWCPDGETFAALCAGYQAIRPLTAAEHQAWPAQRRAAALRFWLLRLDARHQPRAGEVVTIKNPDDFRALLEQFRLAPGALPG